MKQPLFWSGCAGAGIGHLMLVAVIVLKMPLPFITLPSLLSFTTFAYSLGLWGGLLALVYLWDKRQRRVSDAVNPDDAIPPRYPPNYPSSYPPSRLENVVAQLEAQVMEKSWQGFRPFKIIKKATETLDNSIVSFYLTPYDQAKLPRFKPGQYLTFRLDNVPGQPKPVIRCYSLSDAYHPQYYRVSIKRVPSPPNRPELPAGISSNYFHDQLNVGDILDVKAPAGQFYIDVATRQEVVLIAGGVGITPIFSLLKSLLNAKNQQKIWCFYGVTHGEQHAMKTELQAIADQHDNVELVVCYSRPNPTDHLGDYQVKGRLSIDIMKAYFATNNFAYYLCGPGTMMASLNTELQAWGVPDKDIHYEAFGPASAPPSKSNIATDSASSKIEFKQSAQTHQWQPDQGPILAFAQTHDIDIASSCQMGNCGTCQCELLAGNVTYPDGKPGFEIEPGHCLPCVGIPDGPIVLDV